MVHQQQQWLKEFKAYAAKMGFSQILNGGLPAACLKYPEIPVPEEVDESDANYYRKNKDREEIIRQNVKHGTLRQQIVLDYQNALYYALCKASKPHAPFIEMKLQSECLYDDPNNDLPAGEWYDGAKAFRLIVKIWDRLSRKKRYFEHYEGLMLRQLKNVLPSNCSSEHFVRKVNYFIKHINPYLDQTKNQAQLARHIIRLMPELGDPILRIKGELEQQSVDEDPAAVLEKCKDLLDQRNSAGKTAAIDENAFVAAHEPTLDPSGFKLAASPATSGSELGEGAHIFGALTKVSEYMQGKFCEGCPHKFGCLRKPDGKDPTPCAIWDDQARKTEFMAERKRIAAEMTAAGKPTTALPLVKPTDKMREIYNARKAAGRRRIDWSWRRERTVGLNSGVRPPYQPHVAWPSQKSSPQIAEARDCQPGGAAAASL